MTYSGPPSANRRIGLGPFPVLSLSGNQVSSQFLPKLFEFTRFGLYIIRPFPSVLFSSLPFPPFLLFSLSFSSFSLSLLTLFLFTFSPFHFSSSFLIIFLELPGSCL